MATIDPNIALQVRSVADPLETYGKAVSLKSLANKQRMEEAQLAKYEEDRAAEQKLSDLYRSNVDSSGQVNRQGILSGAASGGLGSRIPGLQKGFAEQDKAMMDARKAHIENQGEALKLVSNGMSQLSADPNVTPQAVIQYLASLPPDLVPPDRTAQIVRSLPNESNALRRFLATVGANAEARYKEFAPEFKTIDAGNRIIPGQVVGGQFTPQGDSITKAPEGYNVGPNGLSVDPGFLNAKKQIASAGRPVNNISVNTNKTLLNEVASGLGGQLDAGLAGANAAVSSIQSARGLREALDSGKVITGPGADARIMLTRIGSTLGLTGKDAQETLAKTTEAIQNLAQGELQAAQGMKGQGAITDAERVLLKRAASGDISMTEAELRTLTHAIERSANARIAQHQANTSRLKAVPGGESLIPFYQAPQAPAPTQPAAAPAPQAAPVAAPAAQSWQQAGYTSQAQAVQDARSAISRGADKAEVIRRLESSGITNHGIR